MTTTTRRRRGAVKPLSVRAPLPGLLLAAACGPLAKAPPGPAPAVGRSAAAAGPATEERGAAQHVEVGAPVSIENNRGDTWVPAWTADGEIVSPSNDTAGFARAGSANVAVNRIVGDDPRALTGKTLTLLPEHGRENAEGPDGRSWKSTGCASIDGVLYLFVSRHAYGEKSGDPHRRQTVVDASLLKSTDGGTTWSPSARESYERPMFRGATFPTPYFVDYGRDFQATADGGDRYVYAISNDGFWDNGDRQILGRVPRAKIARLDARDWQFYRGGDGGTDASWGADPAAAKPLVESPGRLGSTGAAYVPAKRRYAMVAWHYPAGGGKMPGASRRTVWDFYSAPKPWGPWVKVGSRTWEPQGYYTPQIAPKFTSADGESLWIFTAGDWNQPSVYRLTAVPVSWR
jgi:hypothetical protein